ncbi:hypothetical protein AYK24_05125 [Thermoplasmatales archaeon SG8-52-4]|nr:MAG: hypothetical protein AYK24_05125 [Thermoplasmatales archaeon SG8-52-4]
MSSKRSITKFTRHFDETIFKSKKFDIKDTILITGTARSGTTWLMEILGVIPGYTNIFEPLNPLYFPQSLKIGFNTRTYLRVDENWKEGEDYLRKIFTGTLHYDIDWLEQVDYTKDNFYNVIIGIFSQLKPENMINQLFSDKLIVKFIRLNRMLPWVAERFSMRSMILIIRHPCAVVASRFKQGQKLPPGLPIKINPFPTKKDILDEAVKIDGINQDLINKLNKIGNLEEILAASWCLDNFVPLSYKKPYPWKVIFYEKLIKDGEQQIKNLFKEIGEKHIPRAAYKHLKIPSKVAHKSEHMIVKKADLQLSKWKKSLTEKQIEKILSIVSAFGLDFYTDDIEPDYDNLTIRN